MIFKNARLATDMASVEITFVQWINPLVQELIIQHVLPISNFKNGLERFDKNMLLIRRKSFPIPAQ
jgi:hypothetical protein